MKRGKRVFLSLIAICFLLLMNPGFIAVQAYAWGTWNSQPQWSQPSWNQPSWNSQPQWNDPAWTTTPDWNDPTWQTPPEWQDPAWQTSPEWQNPAWQTSPEWNNQMQWGNPPWQNAPEWNLDQNNPNTNNPNQNGPDGSSGNPNVTPDGPQPIQDIQPPYNPDYTNPGIEKLNELRENVNPPTNLNKVAPNDDPFFNFEDVGMKDGLEFAVKDVIGGTTELAMKVVGNNNGEITVKDFLQNRAGIYGAGFKALTKGDPTVDFLYDSKDIATGAKGIYDNYNTYKGYKAVADLKKAGDLVASAAKYDELVQAGKTFSSGNAVVSAIAMPFTIYDTVQNVGKFNDAKTSDEKWASGMDLVGNAGSIISGAAAGVALIPGAQPIAAGMLAVGGALSLVSLGHKVWRNREKIVADVKQKYNKAKEKVTGFFKSIFGK